MNGLFRFTDARSRDPAIEKWQIEHPGKLGEIAMRWCNVMRNCGSDVRELMHDGFPTACVIDAAFAYVGVFTAHVNVGFFRGAEIDDPDGLLDGTGKYMRHVRLTPESEVDTEALTRLIEIAYEDMQRRRAAQ